MTRLTKGTVLRIERPKDADEEWARAEMKARGRSGRTHPPGQGLSVLLPSISPAPKPAPPPPKKRPFSSLPKPTLEAVRAAQRKPAKKSRPKKPAWLLPKASKSQAQIDREEHERKYGPPEFQAFLRAHACLGCCYRGPAIQQSHVHTGGKGRKDDYSRTIPLCGNGFRVRGGKVVAVQGCHEKYDNAKQSWPKSRGIDIDVEQDRFCSEYEDHAETLGIERP